MLNFSEKNALFVKVFTQEFMREFQFLSDVVAGRAQRRGEFTDKLVKLFKELKEAPLAGAALNVLAGAVQHLHDTRRRKQMGHAGYLQDTVDVLQLQILVGTVAREAVRRYAYFINTRLSHEPETGIIPFAKSGVERALEYIVRTGAELDEATLLSALIEGRSGAWVSGFSNTHLAGQGIYAKEKLHAEGAYARSAFRTTDGQYWVRSTPKHKNERWLSISNFMASLYDYGVVDFKDKAKTEPTYGYALVPVTLVNQYDYQTHTPSARLLQELTQHPLPFAYITQNEIAAYVNQRKKTQGIQGLRDYLKQFYPQIELGICSDDLRHLTFAGCDLSHCDFSGAIFSGDMREVRFDHSFLVGTTFLPGTQLQRASFQETSAAYLQAEDVDFTGANFNQARFEYAKLSHATLIECATLGTVWNKADLTGIKSSADILSAQRTQMTELRGQQEKNQRQFDKWEKTWERQQADWQQWRSTFSGQLSAMSKAQTQANTSIETLQDQVEALLQAQQHRLTFERYCEDEIATLRTRLDETASTEAVNALQARLVQMEKTVATISPPSVPNLSEQVKLLAQNHPALEPLCETLTHSVGQLLAQVQVVQREAEERFQNLQKELRTIAKQLTARVEKLEKQQKALTQEVGEVKAQQTELKTQVDHLQVTLDVEAAVKEKLVGLRQRILNDENLVQELATYIPVRGAYRITDAESFDLEEKAQDFFVNSPRKVLLLLGNSGGGKSTFNRYYERELWQNYKPGSPVPALIALPNLHNPGTELLREYFSHHGFNEKEIAVLQRDYQFSLILDGYDEIRQWKNLYASNQLHTWQAKILISCRTQYLTNISDYARYFMPYQHEKPAPQFLQEMTVVPFNESQIKAYIVKYLQLHPEAPWQNPRAYLDHIASLPGMRELIETPFLLMIAMEVMPSIVEKYQYLEESERVKITRSKLYDEFFEKWSERQVDKLLIAGDLPDDGHDVKMDILEFSKELAKAMFKEDVTQVTHVPATNLFGAKKSVSPWERFFGNQDQNIVRARRCAPLIKIGPHRFAFFHTSLIEYLSTRDIFDEGTKAIINENISQSIPSSFKPVASMLPAKPWMQTIMVAPVGRSPVVPLSFGMSQTSIATMPTYTNPVEISSEKTMSSSGLVQSTAFFKPVLNQKISSEDQQQETLIVERDKKGCCILM